MSSIPLPDKAFLEGVFGMKSGYVLDFSNSSFETFFSELNIGIYDDIEYPGRGLSKANRLRAFWQNGTNEDVALSLNSLADYIEAKKEVPVIWGDVAFSDITLDHLHKVRNIAQNLKENIPPSGVSALKRTQTQATSATTQATVTDNRIQIEINEDIYNHIEQYLESKDYFHAVEESYKLVRAKLKEITGKEKAHEAFSDTNTEKIFGHAPQDEIEGDFFSGVKFLNMSIQFLRNEKAHTPATQLEENLAIHYISLASLAYDLITRYVSPETIQGIEDAISNKRQSYSSANLFYKDFENARWLENFSSPTGLNDNMRKVLKDKWMSEADFTVSYTHTNIDLMRLEFIAEAMEIHDIDQLIDLPTKDKHGNEQGAGIVELILFLQKKYPDKISDRVSHWIIEAQRE